MFLAHARGRRETQTPKRKKQTCGIQMSRKEEAANLQPSTGKLSWRDKGEPTIQRPVYKLPKIHLTHASNQAATFIPLPEAQLCVCHSVLLISTNPYPQEAVGLEELNGELQSETTKLRHERDGLMRILETHTCVCVPTPSKPGSKSPVQAGM